MKKFLAALGACATFFTSAFICNSASAIDHNKVVFCGNRVSGKTEVMLNIGGYLFNDFDLSSYNSTFTEIRINIDNSGTTLDLCDMADQKKLNSLYAYYLRNSKVSVIVCNYANKSSFNFVRNCVKLVKEHNKNCKIVLAADNAVGDGKEVPFKELDPSKDWQFSEEDVENLGKELEVDCTFSKVSHYSGLNMENLKKEIVHLCTQYDQEHENDTDKKRKRCLIY